MNFVRRLGLGTVQFGLPYGISNSVGRMSEEEVVRILSFAAEEGIRFLDTAPAYGTAEAVLGRCLPDDTFHIISKIPSIGYPFSLDTLKIEEGVRYSLSSLRRETLFALLCHDVNDLLDEGGDALWEVMSKIKKKGLVRKIGASIYAPEEAERLFERYPLDIVQFPLNIFDQRMLRSGMLQKMKARGVELHSRSCFLQGLLLMLPEELPPFFEPLKNSLAELRTMCEKRGSSMLEQILSFVFSVEEIDSVIVGVNSQKQLQQLCQAVERAPCGETDELARFAIDSPEMLEPRLWPSGL